MGYYYSTSKADEITHLLTMQYTQTQIHTPIHMERFLTRKRSVVAIPSPHPHAHPSHSSSNATTSGGS